MKGTERERFAVPLELLNQVSAAVFIPVYFAIVGYRLDFTKSFSPVLLVAFLVGSSLVVLVSIGLATRLAGFRGLDIVNLAVTCNARGGPGIVLASVAFDTGIINASFFTTLVVTAVVTSQACGFWLDFVLLRKGLAAAPGRGSGPQQCPATTRARPRRPRVGGTGRPRRPSGRPCTSLLTPTGIATPVARASRPLSAVDP